MDDSVGWKSMGQTYIYLFQLTSWQASKWTLNFSVGIMVGCQDYSTRKLQNLQSRVDRTILVLKYSTRTTG